MAQCSIHNGKKTYKDDGKSNKHKCKIIDDKKVYVNADDDNKNSSSTKKKSGSSSDASLFAGGHTRKSGQGKNQLTVHSKTPYKEDDEIFEYEARSDKKAEAEKSKKTELTDAQRYELLNINMSQQYGIKTLISSGIANGDSYETIKSNIMDKYGNTATTEPQTGTSDNGGSLTNTGSSWSVGAFVTDFWKCLLPTHTYPDNKKV